jgi:hypothetical protein
MKKIKRGLFLLLALVFLFESWLWDVTGAVVERIVARIPMDRLRHWLTARIEPLPPVGTLCIFLIPAIFLFPMKLAAMWLITQGKVLLGITMVVLAKCIGFGVSSFLFHVCKPKLMQLAWVRWVYHTLISWKEKAIAFIAPYKRYTSRVKQRMLQKLPKGRMLTRMKRIRKIHKKTHIDTDSSQQ